MMRRTIAWGPLALALALVVGNAMAAPEETLEQTLTKFGYARGDSIEQISNFRIDGWNYLDSKHIVVYAGPGKRYLLSTLNNCPDLAYTEQIGFTSTVSYLTKFDQLIVRSPSGMVQHCPISEINKLESLKKNP